MKYAVRSFLSLALLFVPLASMAQGTPEALLSCEKHLDCPQEDVPECNLRLCIDNYCQPKWRAISGFKCDDGDPCTAGDQCKKGECSYTIRLQTPQCVESKEGESHVLCNVHGKANDIVSCSVRVGIAQKQVWESRGRTPALPSALSISFSLDTEYATPVGFFMQKCSEQGCDLVTVKTVVQEDSSLWTNRTSQGHFLFGTPFDLKRWTGVGATLAAHFQDPTTPVVATSGAEFMRIHILIKKDTPPEGTPLLAFPVYGSAPAVDQPGQFINLQGRTGKEEGMITFEPK